MHQASSRKNRGRRGRAVRRQRPRRGAVRSPARRARRWRGAACRRATESRRGTAAFRRQLGMARDRRAARAFEPGEERAFGGDASAVAAWFNGATSRAVVGVVGADLEADRALRHRRQHVVDAASARVMCCARPSRLSPAQARTSRRPRPPRASQRVWTLPRKRTTSRSGRVAALAPAGAATTCRRRRPAAVGERSYFSDDEGVARVLARQHRADAQAVGQHGRHVLHRMHGEVDLAARAAPPRSPW